MGNYMSGAALGQGLYKTRYISPMLTINIQEELISQKSSPCSWAVTRELNIGFPSIIDGLKAFNTRPITRRTFLVF